MREKRKKIRTLNDLFQQNICLTINGISIKLNCSKITASRYLNSFEYFSSYSHNSKWYTIAPILKFDKQGLWRYDSICFSKFGTLKNTVIHFIEQSRCGLTSGQLSELLGITCYSVLSQFYKSGAIDRVKIDRGFVYLSKDEKKKKQQLSHVSQEENLAPQMSVLVLVEYIKNPDSSFSDISTALSKRRIVAPVKAIKQLFKEHNIKKNF
jgi:hypothetical protein